MFMKQVRVLALGGHFSASFLVYWCFFFSQTLLAEPCGQRQELTARQPGIVQRYAVKDAQVVKRGDLIVEFDGRLQRAGLKEAEGAVEAAAANVELAKDALGRLEKLKGTDSIADNQIVETRIKLMAAQALHKQASGAFERVRIQAEDTRLRASISGTVRGLPNVLGMAVQAGQSLGRIEGSGCSSNGGKD
jgi:multidrug efflux pump subunit AcrA (membrane-fusion protein)